MKFWRAAARCGALIALLPSVSFGHHFIGRALADDLTPTVAVQVENTPGPTVEIPTPDLATAVPSTLPPTVTKERSNPLPTVAVPTPRPTMPAATSVAPDI